MKVEVEESSGVGTVRENSSCSVPVSLLTGRNIHLLISTSLRVRSFCTASQGINSILTKKSHVIHFAVIIRMTMLSVGGNGPNVKWELGLPVIEASLLGTCVSRWLFVT